MVKVDQVAKLDLRAKVRVKARAEAKAACATTETKYINEKLRIILVEPYFALE